MNEKYSISFIRKYDVDKLEYENSMILIIYCFLCLFFSFLNLIYFSTIHVLNIETVFFNSLIFTFFSAIYGSLIILKITEEKKKTIINIITAIFSSIFVLRFYEIIGPTVWTYCFIVIIILFIRESPNTLAWFSVVLFFLGIYAWKFAETPAIDDKYFISQFVSFSILFLVSRIVFINNKNKNKLIRDHIESIKDISNNLHEINGALEEEIEEHQKTNEILYISESRFKAVIDAIPDMILKVDRKGVFIEFYSGSYTKPLSDPKNIVGKKIEEIVPENIASESKKILEKLFEENEFNMYEYEYELKEDNKPVCFEARFVYSSYNEAIIIIRNITEIKEKQKEIEYLSYHDQLTGLYNRRFFEEELNRLDTPRNLPITLIMADVNGLKLTNDAFGHIEGDKLLKTVAKTLKMSCREEDIVSRIGGDEFVILLPKTSEEEAKRIVKKIYTKANKESTDKIIISFSLGWATKIAEEEEIFNIFNKAEEEMYRNKLIEKKDIRNRTINLMMKTLNEKTLNEKFHSENVKNISKKIGLALGLSTEKIKEIETVALMHDIGKIIISDKILNKKSPLTKEEYEIIKKHSETGYHILKSIDEYSSLAEYVLYHHENWDGSGYPKKLSGNQIPLISRIISVADSFDMMTSENSYKKKISKEEAVREIKKKSGKQFDPNIVEKLEEILLK